MRTLTPPTRARQALLVPLALVLVLAGWAWQAGRAEGAPIYWGAYIDGGTYGYEDAPYDARTIDAFESHAGKRVSIVHWGQPWYWGSHGGYQAFQRDMAERVRLRGSIPMINWNSWDLDKGGSLDQPDFRLLGDHQRRGTTPTSASGPAPPAPGAIRCSCASTTR